MNLGLIAPCGMNCSLCIAHIREKRKCPGCGGSDENKSESCVRCAIKNCEILNRKHWRHCSDRCPEYPCPRLRQLDKRYRTKYGMSMLENLEAIRRLGVREFVRGEEKRWVRGDKIFCVHKKAYYPLV
jgi:hypothetical protein